MNRSRNRPARGVTLVELLVAVAIGAIVLAALFGVVQSQQTAYFQGHLQRAAQSSARSALAYVEQRLALAGYGMDAPLAFDFRYYGAPPAGPQPCPPLAAPCSRDRTDGNDELVFYARNPRYWLPENRDGVVEPRGYAWRVLSMGPGSIALSARKDDVFEKGRILQVVCSGGSRYAYVTLSQTVGPLAADAPAPGGVSVGLESAVTSPPNDSNPFRQQDAALTQTCFTDGTARAFLIDRYRFHVRPVSTGSVQEPYLVLDTGLDRNNDGPDEAEEIIVAAGIESFQVGYVLTDGTLAPRGVTPGSQIVFTPGPVTGIQNRSPTRSANGFTVLQFPAEVPPDKWLYEPTSFYGYAANATGSISPARLTDHQANIRAIRIAIVARGPEPEPARRRVENLLPVLNQDVLPAWAQSAVPYNRARVETTVLVRNMTARAMNDF